MASARLDCAMPANAVVIGEVGLAGDLRRVTGMDRRLAEAARLGFTRAVVPPGTTAVPAGLRVLTAENIASALRVLRRIADNDGRAQEE
jgi:DNA repair protein RadA/Sms